MPLLPPEEKMVTSSCPTGSITSSSNTNCASGTAAIQPILFHHQDHQEDKIEHIISLVSSHVPTVLENSTSSPPQNNPESNIKSMKRDASSMQTPLPLLPTHGETCHQNDKNPPYHPTTNSHLAHGSTTPDKYSYTQAQSRTKIRKVDNVKLGDPVHLSALKKTAANMSSSVQQAKNQQQPSLIKFHLLDDPNSKTDEHRSNFVRIDEEQIRKVFHLTQRQAAASLGVSLSTLKRRFYEMRESLGIDKWPTMANDMGDMPPSNTKGQKQLASNVSIPARYETDYVPSNHYQNPSNSPPHTAADSYHVNTSPSTYHAPVYHTHASSLLAQQPYHPGAVRVMPQHDRYHEVDHLAPSYRHQQRHVPFVVESRSQPHPDMYREGASLPNHNYDPNGRYTPYHHSSHAPQQHSMDYHYEQQTVHHGTRYPPEPTSHYQRSPPRNVSDPISRSVSLPSLPSLRSLSQLNLPSLDPSHASSSDNSSLGSFPSMDSFHKLQIDPTQHSLSKQFSDDFKTNARMNVTRHSSFSSHDSEDSLESLRPLDLASKKIVKQRKQHDNDKKEMRSNVSYLLNEQVKDPFHLNQSEWNTLMNAFNKK